MTAKRVILEMCAGNDLHGKDYTKAACRAVEDAPHRSSLVMIHTLGVNESDVLVDVTIGVQQPDEIETDTVKAKLPIGQVTVRAIKGGLDQSDPDTGDTLVIASAAIAVRLDLA